MEPTEIKSEEISKTPADLEREKITKGLGLGWEWFTNRPLETDLSTEDSLSTRKIIKELARQHKQGTIMSYRTRQPAFDKNGNLIEGMMAIYIQRPLPEISIK